MEERRIQSCGQGSTQGGEEVKSTRVRTLRGQVTVSGNKADQQLILNDQLINRGLRVTGFFVWPDVATKDSDRSFSAILSYAQLADANVRMNAGDNSQLGWSWNVQAKEDTSIPPGLPYASSGYLNQLIDPDHIINRDLFIAFRFSSNATYNYMIVCEMVELDDNEAIITIIKENSQSVE